MNSLIWSRSFYLSAAAGPGSPAGRWGGYAPRRRSSRPQEGGKAAGGLDPPPAEPLAHHFLPAHLLCFLPLPPRGLSAPAHTQTHTNSENQAGT